ncbi:MAG: DUF4388 domain-containing protein, partial [Myxococcales bacterium]|nr:DUF4388 domain-containing protein [Myxococcales bacterium]
MAPSKLLLVDSDARSVRVLEVSLKKAGFEVATSSSVEGALRLAEQLVPDLVVTETQLPDHTGFMLCQQLRAAPATSHTGVLFLSEAADAQTKVEAINVGADVFLAKPVLVKDIIVQIQSILEKRQTDSIARRERPGNLSGTLANMGVVDLLQIMEAGKKSGIVHVSSDPLKSGGYVAEGHERGTIFFRDGQVIDSRLGKLRGVEAVYRMLLWDDGVFEIEFKQVSRDNVVRSTTQSILLEGMRRVDEWSRFAKRLPPLNARLAVDFDTLNKAFSGVPADVKPVLHLFDGKRTLFEVVADAPVGDTEALEVVARLNDNGVLQNAPAPAAPSSSIPAAESQVEEWLSGPASPARALPGELPSALGRAVIPSRETPSQILAAAPVAPAEDEAEALTPVPSATAIPEPIPDQPSLVLSRHTVPANRAVPLTSTPTPEPIPLTQPTGTPKLRIQRVASTLSAPARAATGEIRAPLPRTGAVSSRPSSRASSASVALAEPPVETPTLTDVPFSQTEAIEEAVRVAAAAPEPARHSVGQRGGSYIVAPAAPPPWPVARTPEPVTEDES